MTRRGNRRNLIKRGGTYYVEAIVKGRRIKRSLRTGVLEDAIQRRDAVLREAIAERERAAEPELPPKAPHFADLVADALAASEKDHAYRTHADYKKALATDGPIIPWLGQIRVDAIKSSDLGAWWSDANSGVGTKTGRNRLDAIAWVLEFAVEAGHIEFDQKTKPLRELRRTLHRRSKTKKGRAERDQRKRAKDKAISPEQFARLAAAAEDHGPDALAMVLLPGECGLRLGEINAVRWLDVEFGHNEDDPERAILVRITQGRDGPFEYVKSGRRRGVWLSKRLRRVLLEVRSARVTDGPEDRVLAWRYDGLIWKRQMLARLAGVDTTFQGLRSTANSLLLDWGVRKDSVLDAIGHEGQRVNDEHYRKRGKRGYHAPEPLADNELPTDLFERLCRVPESQKSHQKSHHYAPPADRARVTPRKRRASGGVPNGTRTRVAALKGRSPGPLDDGDALGERREYRAKVRLSL